MSNGIKRMVEDLEEERILELRLILSKKLRTAATVLPDCVLRLERFQKSPVALPLQSWEEIDRILRDLKTLITD